MKANVFYCANAAAVLPCGAAADKISVKANASGIYVSGPFNTAKVIKSDVLAGLSALHVIDSVVIAS